MKALKVFFLTILSVLFVVSALFLQANLALNCTVFSSGYFGLMFDHNVKQPQLQQVADELAGSAWTFMPLSDAERKALQEGKASKELKKRAADFEASFRKALDGKWLAKEAPNLAKGLFAFFSGGSGKLPSVDISPLKSAMLDSYLAQFRESGSLSKQDFEAMVMQIELTSGGFVRNGKANSAAVNQLLQMGKLMGMKMSKATAEDICLKIGNRDKDGSTTEDLMDYTVSAVASDMMGGSIGDKLDLNVLFASAYGKKNNPVTGFSTMLGGLRGSLMLLSAVVLLLLAGAIAAATWKRQESFRWIGVPLIASGALGLILPVLALLLRTRIAEALTGAAGSAVLNQILTNWALSYLGGVIIFLFAQCLVFAAIGWALLVLSRKAGSGKHAAGAKGNGPLRAVVAVVLIAAIPFSAFLIGRGVMAQVDQYDSIMKASARQKNIDFGGAMIKALGADVP